MIARILIMNTEDKKKVATKMTVKPTTVVNIRKAELNKRGIKSLEDWSLQHDNVYIGRDMSVYVKGAKGSKWKNPFSVKQYGREQCLIEYEKYVKRTPELLDSLEELRGKELGCWCFPEGCHGDVLIKLLNEITK